MGATGRGRRWCELSYADRYYIEVSLKNGKTAAQIARDLSRARSTIVREVRRGMCEQRRSGRKRTVRVYKADYAQLVHDRRRAKCGAKIKLGHDHETAAALEEYVVDRGYSPYAAIEAARAAGRLATSVCTTTFYSYIRKGVLGFGEEQLIRGFMPRKRRSAPGLFEDRCQTKHRARGGRSIEERPRAVLSRLEFGHWEGDLVVSAQGGKAAVLTLLERKTRYLIATRVDDKKVSSVAAALDLLEKRWGPPSARSSRASRSTTAASSKTPSPCAGLRTRSAADPTARAAGSATCITRTPTARANGAVTRTPTG